jgi:hypothetical protein
MRSEPPYVGCYAVFALAHANATPLVFGRHWLLSFRPCSTGRSAVRDKQLLHFLRAPWFRGEESAFALNVLSPKVRINHGIGTGMKKKFFLSGEQMKQLVPEGLGGCFITDRVTVDGLKIGYMYREVPDRPEDSGWRFFSGDESEDYINDPSHTGIYDLNTAANYDPDVVPYLDTRPPCAFEKVAEGHEYERVEDAGLSDAEFPVVEGHHQLTDDWAVTLPAQFNQRVEDDSLVLWRPGITVWTTIWNNDEQEAQQERFETLRSAISPAAFDVAESVEGDLIRFAYRLNETREESMVHAVYGFAIGPAGHVQMAIYCDEEADLKLAWQVWRSLKQISAA